jgi:hypothetical protein
VRDVDVVLLVTAIVMRTNGIAGKAIQRRATVELGLLFEQAVHLVYHTQLGHKHAGSTGVKRTVTRNSKNLLGHQSLAGY